MLSIFDRHYGKPNQLPLSTGPQPLLTILYAHLVFMLKKSKHSTLRHLIHHTFMTAMGHILIRLLGYGGYIVIVVIFNVV
ncbi:uncharacterized protein Dmoj_GI25816 [Drosophila mojavensis]|uniref:Very-long-chain 3-oxoacyl-CoA synthase n=1 Tax=Drosophila mojavensis TaxID=7230 RepID=A0A0Q9X138_DROMO|nr:uncharacterized protein Dmoj_GI25816 [Drosophila mojavensis]